MHHGVSMHAATRVDPVKRLCNDQAPGAGACTRVAVGGGSHRVAQARLALPHLHRDVLAGAKHLQCGIADSAAVRYAGHGVHEAAREAQRAAGGNR